MKIIRKPYDFISFINYSPFADAFLINLGYDLVIKCSKHTDELKGTYDDNL